MNKDNERHTEIHRFTCPFCMHPSLTARWNRVFLLTVPARRASFMVKIIESIKRNASPEKQRNNSLAARYFAINSHTNMFVIYLLVNHEY